MKKTILFLLVAMISINSFAQIPPYISLSGLKAWYPFNNNANDSSGFANNGVPYGGVSYGTDRFGAALRCYVGNGASGIDVPVNNFPVGNAARSISVFFKSVLPYPGGYRELFANGNNSAFGQRFGFITNDTIIGLEYTNGLVVTRYTPDSFWHLIVVTYSGIGGSSGVKVYLDGIITVSTIKSPIPSFSTATSPIHGMGALFLSPAYTYSWVGSLDDVGVWDRDITPCEVYQIWTGKISFSSTITGASNVCIGSTIALTDTVAGGTWSSSNTAIAKVSTAGIVTGLSAGTGTISYSVTNVCGITTATKIITIDSLPNAGTITGPSDICVGSAITLSDAITGGIWSSSNTGVATVSGGVVTGISSGSSTISYTVTSCGTATATHTVLVIKSPDAGIISGPSVVCVGASITLSDNIAGGIWSSSKGLVAITGTGMVTGISAGNDTIKYTVTKSVCSATAIKIITAMPLPDAGAISGPSSVCAGSSITLSDIVTGGVWSSSNSNVAVSGSVDVDGITPGTSIISYIVTNTCGSDTATKTITVNQLPDAGTITGPPGVCAGTSITLSDAVTGGVWSSSNSIVAVAGGGVTGITAGTCTISYTVTNSCGTVAATKIITVNPLPDAGIITGLSIACKGATFKLSETVPGGKWSSGNVNVVGVDSVSGMINALSEGTTTITYSTAPNGNGCINSTTFPLTISKLLIAGNISQVTCYGSNNGSITATVSGGTGHYQYAWPKGDSSSVINNLPSGSYTLQVKDIFTQCIALDSFIVKQSDSLLVTANAKNDTCNTGNGNVSVLVAGGTAPYQYLWSNNATTNNVTGLLAGAYTIVVTDKNNCKKSLSVIVEEDSCVDVIIHDVITPNGDGINDVWLIEGIQNYSKNTVQIFDKWGSMLYEKNGYNNDWTGRGSKGELLPDGTYFYLVKLNTPVGKNVFTGALLIKR